MAPALFQIAGWDFDSRALSLVPNFTGISSFMKRLLMAYTVCIDRASPFRAFSDMVLRSCSSFFCHLPLLLQGRSLIIRYSEISMVPSNLIDLSRSEFIAWSSS